MSYSKWFIRLGAAAYASFIVAIIVFADTGACGAPCKPAEWFPYGDKIGHVTLLAMLAYVINVAVPSSRGRFGLSTVSAAILAAISFEECSQLMFETRTADVFDQLANCVGVIVGDVLSRDHAAVLSHPRRICARM